MLRNVVLSVVIMALMSLPVTASAMIWNVHPDSAVTTIQAGIDSSSHGDTVLVYPSTYLENINFNGKNIVVGSLFLTTGDTSHISSTIIDGDQSGSVVTLKNGEDSTAVIAGFTIRNGDPDPPGGGGIHCSYSSPTLANLIISENAESEWWESYGGGIYCYGSSPSLENVTISRNSSSLPGGGIYCDSSSPSLTNVIISENSAWVSGGGIFCTNSSDPSLLSVTISRNTVRYGFVNEGGGICCRYNSSPTLTHVTVSENTADAGGGIFCGYGSSPSLSNVTISANNASAGGGVYCEANSSPNLTNVTISGNTAEWGGGISCSGSSPTLTNVTMSGNTAENAGGGIDCNVNSSASLANVTMSRNTAGSGGGIWCEYNSSVSLANCILWNDAPQEICVYGFGSPSSVSVSYSDIQGDSAGIVTDDNCTVYWLEGNVDEDPLFADTANADFSLTQGSPCIDAGTPDTTGLGLPPWDILGSWRIWDGDGNGSTIIDMGAYEFDAPPYTGIDDEVVSEPKTPIFLHNYPNPLNPQTTIQYGLPKDDRVSLRVYNLLGQEVRALVNERKDAGIHTIIWDGRDESGRKVSSGSYFLRLETVQHTATKKLCVVR